MATRRPKKKAAKKRTWGGVRAGSGRRALYHGPRELVTMKLTATAREAIAAQAEEMRETHGDLASSSAAVEFLVRKGRGLPTDVDEPAE